MGLVPLVRSVFCFLSGVSGPRDWIGTDVVFHSPVILRLHGESSRDCEGVFQLHALGDPVSWADWKGLVPLEMDNLIKYNKYQN